MIEIRCREYVLYFDLRLLSSIQSQGSNGCTVILTDGARQYFPCSVAAIRRQIQELEEGA